MGVCEFQLRAPVRAVLLADDEASRLAAIGLGADAAEINHGRIGVLVGWTDEGHRVRAHAGEWLVSYPDGRLEVMCAHKFEQRFQSTGEP